jgi:pSer/pThr/pTyr-binding forkhead associated (FHA) protein
VIIFFLLGVSPTLFLSIGIAMIYKLTLLEPVEGITTQRWTFSPPAVLGREPGSAICIDHDSISRKHCQFTTNSDEALVIKDLGSRNGTYVDDVRIHHETLMPGQTIQIGALRLQIAFSTEEEIVRRAVVKPKGSVTETRPMQKIQPPQPEPPPKPWWKRLFE